MGVMKRKLPVVSRVDRLDPAGITAVYHKPI